MPHQEWAQKSTAIPLAWPRAISTMLLPFGFQDKVRALEEQPEGQSRLRRRRGTGEEERPETRRRDFLMLIHSPLTQLSRSKPMRIVRTCFAGGSGVHSGLWLASSEMVLSLELMIRSPFPGTVDRMRTYTMCKAPRQDSEARWCWAELILKNELREWGHSGQEIAGAGFSDNFKNFSTTNPVQESLISQQQPTFIG